MKNFLNTLFLCVALLCAASLFNGTASATIIPGDLAIDFRSGDWAGAYGQSEYSFGNVTVKSYDADNGGLTALLYQDGVDGLGVLGGEGDEIDSYEFIWVHILGGMMLNGVWITDLFGDPDGGSGEEGQMLFRDMTGDWHWYDFSGNDADQDNGEIWVDFEGEFLVNYAAFGTEPWPDPDDNEFSVAGFTAAAVPEPTTMLLVGVGLIGLAGLGRKRFLKKT